LTTTTGRLVVRRTVRVSSSSSMASVCSDTWTRTARPAWTRPSETRWRQTVITPVVLTRRWTVTGLGPGPRRWTGGPGALEPERLLRRERVGAHVRQLARLRVEEHQGLRLDADDHGPSAEDLGRGHLAAGQGDDAALVDRAVDLDRRSILGRRSGGGPAATAPRRASWARSAVDRCERRLLTRAPAIDRWITSTPAQKRTV
jgi:hypothetical protein